MALNIKKGAVISPYGEGANSFTDKDILSQPVLAHLQSRFPDDIEGKLDAVKEAKPEVSHADPVFVDVPASVSGDKIAVTSIQDGGAVLGAPSEQTPVPVEALEKEIKKTDKEVAKKSAK